jgi:hypothetical protein
LKEYAEKFSTFLINTIWIHNAQLKVYNYIYNNNNNNNNNRGTNDG